MFPLKVVTVLGSRGLTSHIRRPFPTLPAQRSTQPSGSLHRTNSICFANSIYICKEAGPCCLTDAPFNYSHDASA